MHSVCSTTERGEDVGQVIGRLSEFVRSAAGPVAPTPTTPGARCPARRPVEPQRAALDRLLVLGTCWRPRRLRDGRRRPAVVPSVQLIRRRFNDRRQRKHPPLQRLVRALLGVDAKLSQYTRGRAFVDHVVDRVRMARFNAVWRGRRRCHCPTRSRIPSGGSTGCSSAAARDGGGVRGVPLPDTQSWCVALSGGPDSLALTAAATATLPTTALIVDHGLQPGSAAVAQTALEQALEMGCIAARFLRLAWGRGGPGPPPAPPATPCARRRPGGAPVLLAHTPTIRPRPCCWGWAGSGPRSIAGMRPGDPPWYRPLLGTRRSRTHAACMELGLPAWDDPHNHDRRFTRARLRHEVLPCWRTSSAGRG